MYVKPYYEQDYEDKEYYELNKPRIKSVDDWKKILINELEFNTGFDFIHNVLVEMYYSLDKTIFCKELEKKIGRGDINLQVGHFRDRIKGYIETSYVEQIGNDTGKDRAWNIPFYSNEKINNLPENIGKFSWVLRDELVQAMEELEIVNAKDTRVMTFPINGTEDIIQKYNIHAHPVKRGYPKQITPFVAFRINGGSIDKVFKLKHVTECSPSNISLIKNQLTPEEYKKLLGYVNDRYDTFGFGESDVDYRFYFLEEYKDLLPRFVMKKNNQNAKVYSLDELISGNEYNQRILFCNVAYMRHYDYINFKETPVNGGQYIDDTGDAFEKNNFHRCEDGKVKGFVETKYVGGYDNKTRTPKQLHIENIDSNYKNLDEIEDVTVVFCAKNPNKNINATVIVGWYKNAKVYRNRKEYLGRVYNIEANFDEAVLLPEHNRVKIIPRATTNKDNIGFGQANIWYANKSEHKTLVLDVLNYINDCNN